MPGGEAVPLTAQLRPCSPAADAGLPALQPSGASLEFSCEGAICTEPGVVTMLVAFQRRATATTHARPNWPVRCSTASTAACKLVI